MFVDLLHNSTNGIRRNSVALTRNVHTGDSDISATATAIVVNTIVVNFVQTWSVLFKVPLKSYWP